jgi:hypothetical protein
VRGSAYVFINFEQAARCGHVGWGISLGDGQNFHFGSTDHLYKHSYWNLPALLRYAQVLPGGDIDWWAHIGTESEMLEAMRNGHHIRYHAYKVLEVDQPDPERGVVAAESLRHAGWHVTLNNCVHHVHSVISGYSSPTGLPDPSKPVTNLIPRQWFAAIERPAVTLE